MYNETLAWIENALDSLHETGKMGSLHWRATYTEEDHKALKLLEQWMREKDLEVFYDDIGNLFGKIEGEQSAMGLSRDKITVRVYKGYIGKGRKEPDPLRAG